MKESEIYDKCIAKWGFDSQMRQCQEECAELVVAINHFCRREIGSDLEVTEELADVQNMVNQLKDFFPFFEDYRISKLERIAKRLVDNPPEDVLLIERVTRYGENNLDGIEFDELKKYETLYEREGEK